jgi:hypothetical protein
MFRIEAFCDDKNLPRVLHALAGLVHGQPAIQPVANAQVTNGELHSSGDLTEQFGKYAKVLKLKKFVAGDLTEFTKMIGLAPSSRQYVIKQLLTAKAIRKHGAGSKMTYTVVS